MADNHQAIDVTLRKQTQCHLGVVALSSGSFEGVAPSGLEGLYLKHICDYIAMRNHNTFLDGRSDVINHTRSSPRIL